MNKIKNGDYAVVCKPLNFLPDAEGSIVQVVRLSTTNIRFPVHAQYVHTPQEGDFSVDELQLITIEGNPEYFI
jgi:hypothetical protein